MDAVGSGDVPGPGAGAGARALVEDMHCRHTPHPRTQPHRPSQVTSSQLYCWAASVSALYQRISLAVTQLAQPHGTMRPLLDHLPGRPLLNVTTKLNHCQKQRIATEGPGPRAATHGVALPGQAGCTGVPWARQPRYAASRTRAARRARTASARLSSTASELSQPMQPSVMLWP